MNKKKNTENLSVVNDQFIPLPKTFSYSQNKSQKGCQKQNKILEDIENLESLAKKSNQDFAFIQYMTDSATNVVKSNKLLLGSNNSLGIGKGFFHEFAGKILPITILVLGSRKECEEQSIFISSYENLKYPKLKPKEKELSVSELRTLSQSVSKSSITVQPRTNDFYEAKISELELALKEKDLKINDLEILLKKEEQINAAFRNTYKSEEIPKMVEFSLNFAKLFAKTSDLCEIPLYSDELSENYFILSKKYSNITIQTQTKHSFDALLTNPTESDTKIFRRLIVILIPEIEIWAKSCKQIIKEMYNERILAAFEYIQNKRKTFKISSADAEVGSLTAEARRKLKEKGFEFAKVKVDNKTYFRYDIISRPDFPNNCETNSIFLEIDRIPNEGIEQSDDETKSRNKADIELNSNNSEDDSSSNTSSKNRVKKRKFLNYDDEDE